MKKTSTSKFPVVTEHCFWAWYTQPINGESYHSVLAETPEQALKSAGKNKMAVERVFDCYNYKNYNVAKGQLVN